MIDWNSCDIGHIVSYQKYVMEWLLSVFLVSVFTLADNGRHSFTPNRRGMSSNSSVMLTYIRVISINLIWTDTGKNS